MEIYDSLWAMQTAGAGGSLSLTKGVVARECPLSIVTSSDGVRELGVNEIAMNYDDITYKFGPQNLLKDSTVVIDGNAFYGDHDGCAEYGGGDYKP